MKAIFATWIFVSLSFAAISQVLPVTHCVDAGNASPAAPYLTWTTAATNIQDAIDHSAPGDVVLVTNGIYAAGGRAVHGTMTNRVVVDKPLVVRSVNGPRVTIISGYQVPDLVKGDGAIRCVFLTNGAVLSGFTLTNGATRASGEDHERSGGGVWCVSEAAVVKNCILTGNSASDSGGGAFSGTLNNCIINNNDARRGGGLHSSKANNSLMVRNVAIVEGGGVVGSVLNNCTIVANSVDTPGTGGGAQSSSMTNCILYANIAGAGLNYHDSSLDYCCAAPLSDGNGNIDLDPRFLGTAYGDYRLATNSPCIDAGKDEAWMAGCTDLDDNQRIMGTRVDMGAYEFPVAGAPRIVSQPADQMMVAGHDVTFSVTAQGDQPMIYQWHYNGMALVDATNAMLVVTNIQLTNRGDYSVVVRNAKGVVVSDAAALCVIGPVQYLVNIAATGSVVTVPAGFFIDNVVIDKDLVLEGSGPDTTIIDGFQLGRVFTMKSNTSVVLNNMTIQGGRAKDGADAIWDDYPSEGTSGENGQDGGGIHSAANLVISNCVVRNNRSGDGGNGRGESGGGGDGGRGGGVFAASGTMLEIQRSVISNNIAGSGGRGGIDLGCGVGGDGGGVYAAAETELKLIECAVSNNRAGNGGDGGDYDEWYGQPGEGGMGGGIWGDNVEIERSTIFSNGSGWGGSTLKRVGLAHGGDGGGVVLRTGFINDSVFLYNSGGKGGDAHFQDAGNGGRGGAVFGKDTVLLESCVFAENLAGKGGDSGEYGGGLGGGGGAICIASGRPVLRNCVFLNNAAGDGGGGLDYPGGETNGFGGDGGGVYMGSSCVSLVDSCEFVNNSSGNGGPGWINYWGEEKGGNGGHGGGLFFSAGEVKRTAFVRNRTGDGGPAWADVDLKAEAGHGGDGGGVWLGDGAILKDCLLVANRTGAGGEGIDNSSLLTAKSGNGGNGAGCWAGASVILNTTILDNLLGEGGAGTTPGQAGLGGGLYISNGTVLNCILWNNDGTEIHGSGFSVAYCDVQFGASEPWFDPTTCLDADPLLLRPDQGYYQLRSSSPCINAGTNYALAAESLDLNGYPRILDGRVDMGAYEQSISNRWLIVHSQLAGSTPSAGTSSYPVGAEISSFVNSPVSSGDTQYVAVGWSGGGGIISGRGTNVTFLLTEDSFLSWNWHAQASVLDHHLFEAEDGILTSPMVAADETGASGGRFIMTEISNQGAAEYAFSAAGGNYVIWARCKAGSPIPASHDSFSISVDGGTNEVWDLFYEANPDPTTNWTWDAVSTRGGAGTVGNNHLDPRVFEFTPGLHTIKFSGRESQAKIDRLLITSDLSYDPRQGTALLMVQSLPQGVGTPWPFAYGPNWAAENVLLTNSVVSPIHMDVGARMVCMGWSGVNTGPTNGFEPVAVFSATFQATQTWHWAMEYWLETEAVGEGSVSHPGAWLPSGSQVDVRAIASPGSRFIGWNGTGTNYIVSGDTASPEITLHLEGPAELVANFGPGTIVRGMDAVAQTPYRVVVPIEMTAIGDENGVGFSLYFDPTKLAYSGAEPVFANTFINDLKAASGVIGCGLVLGPGETFPQGTTSVLRVAFDVVAPRSRSAQSSIVSFGDAPVVREVVGADAGTLGAAFIPGEVTIPPATFEGDIAPRPDGDMMLTIADWVQSGRFIAGLDETSQEDEFQRADCAPRETLGDGRLSAIDWVQAGRYTVGLDPLSFIGGPTSPVSQEIPAAYRSRTLTLTHARTTARSLKVLTSDLIAGTTNIVTIALEAEGNESALGLSVHFDPTRLTYIGMTNHLTVPEFVLHNNIAAAGDGRLGLGLSLPIGTVFPSGRHELVNLLFYVLEGAYGSTPVVITNTPVWLEISDPSANPLPTLSEAATLKIWPPKPTLSIAAQGGEVVLSWPAAHAHYTLDQCEDLENLSWSPVEKPAITNGSTLSVTISVNKDQTFYRLRRD